MGTYQCHDNILIKIIDFVLILMNEIGDEDSFDLNILKYRQTYV